MLCVVFGGRRASTNPKEDEDNVRRRAALFHRQKNSGIHLTVEGVTRPEFFSVCDEEK
nr:MAG TPA_asm: hypothetical protein [Caudoviricetes sp.]